MTHPAQQVVERLRESILQPMEERGVTWLSNEEAAVLALELPKLLAVVEAAIAVYGASLTGHWSQRVAAFDWMHTALDELGKVMP